jgi:hypothetical protein
MELYKQAQTTNCNLCFNVLIGTSDHKTIYKVTRWSKQNAAKT